MPGGRLIPKYKCSTTCLLEPHREKLKLNGEILNNACGLTVFVCTDVFVYTDAYNVYVSITHLNITGEGFYFAW